MLLLRRLMPFTAIQAAPGPFCIDRRTAKPRRRTGLVRRRGFFGLDKRPVF